MQDFNYYGTESAYDPNRKMKDAGDKLALTAGLLLVLELSLTFVYSAFLLLAPILFPQAVSLLQSQVFMQFVLYLPSFLLAIFLCRTLLENHNLRFHPEISKTSFSQMFPQEKVPALVFVGCVFLALAAAMIGNFISSGLDEVITRLNLPKPEASIEMPTSVGGIVFYFFTVAVLPAFLEEILWRGAVYAYLRECSPWTVALVSGFFFMFFHENFAQFPLAFCFGFVLGYLMGRFRNIWIGIVAHFINNAMACVLQLMENQPYFELASAIYVLLCLLIGLLAFVLFLAFGTLKGEKNHSGCPTPAKAVLTRPVVLGYDTICVIMAIITLLFWGQIG